MLRYLTILLFTTAPFSAGAADLLESWRSALSHDPVISAARAAWLAGQEIQPQSLAGLLPQAHLSGNLTHNRQESHIPGFDARPQSEQIRGYSVSVSQVLYNAKTYAQYQQGKKQTQQANAQLAAAQQQLILRVAQAYFDVLLAAERVEQIARQKEAITQQMKHAKMGFELGVNTITDYNEAQARHDETMAIGLAAQNDLLIKQHALTQIAQVDPHDLASIDPNFTPSTPEPSDLNSWLQQARDNSPEIQEKILSLAVAKDEIEKHRLLRSPTLHVEASYATRKSKPLFVYSADDLRQNNASVGLVLTVPLSTGGYRSAKLRQAAAEAEQSRQQLEATIRQVQHKTQAAFLGVNSGIAQISALQQALESSQSLVKSSLLGREVGVRTTEDILNAQQQYYTVKYKLVEAKVQYLLSRLQLAAHSGVLQEKDLQQINQALAR